MTVNGGSNGYGVIFSFDAVTLTYIKLKDFDFANGGLPQGSLIQATDGKLYGMTVYGGSNSYGVIFSYDPSTGMFSKLKDFDYTNGGYPHGSLIQATNGKLYGMTVNGGNNGYGVIFSFDPVTLTYTKLQDFNGGGHPNGSLIQAANGKLYGMLSDGGSNYQGAIFSFEPSTSTYTKLRDFDNTNGAYPYGSFTQATDGKLYGMTHSGGSYGDGVAFSYDPSTSVFTKLQDFNGTNGANPYYTAFTEAGDIAPSISTSALSSNSLCPGSQFSLAYTATGTFNEGNVFIAQLSDASGSFASPIDIGNVNVTTSGNINVTIPVNTPAGTLYRIRVVSSDPSIIGKDNGSDITINTIYTYYSDNDNDGFGDANNSISVCSSVPPTGYVTDNTDCDDAKPLYADNDGDGFGTGAPVACGVANNSDCNDADASVHSTQIYFADNDGDGFGDANNSISVCSSTPPTGYVTDNTDCDDSKLLYADNDGDGFGAGSPVACGIDNNSDCNDADATVHSSQTYFADNDGDGFGDANNSISVCSSTPPIGYVTNSTDCNDTKLLYADNDGDGFGAGAPVACGVADNTDCNNDDASVNSGITYYADNDGDGFGDANNSISVCSSTPPIGYVTDNTDCNDIKLLYADNDGDGFGAGAPVACGVADNTDCNDNDASVHSGITYYRDADGDGFGDANNTTSVCSSTPPIGYVTNSTDCNDTKLLYADNDGDGFGAGSPVGCGVNNNFDCNDADASVHSGITYYADNDGDGFGDANNSISVCSSVPPTGYVTDNTDCNDAKLLYADNDGDGFGAGSPVSCGVAANTDCNDNNPAVHPGAVEICGNGIDDNCNGQVDEGCTVSGVQISITDNSITEGNKGTKLMHLTVKLNKKSVKIIRVNYAAQNGSATAGSDYIAQSGTLVFLPGTKAITLSISIKGDKIMEANETFKVVLSNAVNATIVDGTGIGTIINDDGAAASISIADNSKVERSVFIYPNPANNIINIELNGYSGNLTIQLADMQGKMLQEKKVQTGIAKFAQQQIDVTRVTSGIYFITVFDENGNRQTKKVIVAH